MAGDVAKDSLDLYHGLTHELPRKIEKLGVKTAVTVHDLIFFRYPEQYRWIDRNVYEWKYRTSCNVADRVVAISEQTKLDVVEYFGIPPEKISVLYQTCDEGFYEKVEALEKDRIRTRYGLPKDYVLYVGSFTERKNTIALVHAFAKVQKKHGVHLVLVGAGGLYGKKMESAIQDLGISDSVAVDPYAATF